MITPTANPASKTAHGLAVPTNPAIEEGNPKTPLPMMELTINAARLQRPMARTRVVLVTEGLYHNYCLIRLRALDPKPEVTIGRIHVGHSLAGRIRLGSSFHL